MKKIDTKTWRNFSLHELGFKNHHGSRLNKAHRVEGEIPFLTAGKENQGVSTYISNDVKTYKNPITVDMFGNCFYHPFKCGGDDNVYFFVNDDVSEFSKIFISTSINSVTSKKYSYSEQFRQPDADCLCVMLPVSNDDQPDWEYMDTYMSEVLRESEGCLENLRAVSTARKAINIKNWKEFIVGELFPNIWKPTVLHTRQVEESETGFPYVVRTKFNNGIKYRIKPLEKIDPTPPGCISWGAENSSFFYQEEAFYSGRDIYCIDTRKLSLGTCLFLCSCLQQIADKYSYNFGLFPEHLKSETIYLPVNSEGMPDWEYMCSYMKDTIEISRTHIKELSKI